MAYALAVVLIDRVPSDGGAGLGADLVDAGQAVQEPATNGITVGRCRMSIRFS